MPNPSLVHRVLSAARRWALTAVPVVLAAAQSAASRAPVSTEVMAGDRAAQACFDSMSDGSLGRLTVSPRAVIMDANAALVAQAALVSQHISQAARAALGGVGDSLPAGDAFGVWRESEFDYREFIDTSRELVLRTRFRPARIGGCTIRQLVHLSFKYGGRNAPSSP